MATPAHVIETNRKRYEELRRAGQGEAKHKLPPLTQRSAAKVPAVEIMSRELIPPTWYTTLKVRRGEIVRIVDDEGSATPAIMAWRSDDTSERLNLADTLKVQWTARLQRGHALLSDMGRVIMSIVEDTCGAHDGLTGGMASSEGPRHTRGNFVAAALKFGLDRRDISAALCLFAPIGVDTAGHFVWASGRKAAGDFVDLRAEMDLLLAISNIAHPLSGTAPGPVTVMRITPRKYPDGDPCASGVPEIQRAYEFTSRLAR